MWQLYQEGNTFAKIAKRMQRDPSTVSRYVHEYEALRVGAMCGSAACKFN